MELFSGGAISSREVSSSSGGACTSSGGVDTSSGGLTTLRVGLTLLRAGALSDKNFFCSHIIKLVYIRLLFFLFNCLHLPSFFLTMVEQYFLLVLYDHCLGQE